jgi:hypothetical protein
MRSRRRNSRRLQVRGDVDRTAGQSTAAAGQTTAAAASGAGGSSAADGLGHPVDVCSLLPVATVAQLSGEPITVAKEDDLTNAKAYTCAYTDAIGTSNVAVTVLAMNAAASYNAGVAANGSGAKQISGVGDKAYSAITGVCALFGDVMISVTGLNSDDDAVKIIQTLQPKR